MKQQVDGRKKSVGDGIEILVAPGGEINQLHAAIDLVQCDARGNRP